MKLPDKIIKHRKANGWSQEDFAEKLNVSRQAISRWENGTALPDAQNILQISKLFHVTTDYLLNDDYESDSDIPAVQSETKKTEDLISKKKRLHLIAAIGFTISWFCSLMGVVNSVTDIQLGLSCFTMTLCVGNAIAQFVLYFKKR
ncbi:MAG: helix-turn-helix transcriptional regulator [Oscillospiraceae bacterium]|nr:helix-turn-helix transcriptional regulator [Oscillospiraceae bacterium]